jgi:hypothetical protein
MLAQSQIRGMANEHARGMASIGLQRQKQEWDRALAQQQLEQQKEAEARAHSRGIRSLQQQEAESMRAHGRGLRGLDIQEQTEARAHQRGLTQLQQQEAEYRRAHGRGVRGMDIQQTIAEREHARALQSMGLQEQASLREHERGSRGLAAQEAAEIRAHARATRGLTLQERQAALEHERGTRGLAIQAQSAGREHLRGMESLRQQEAAEMRAHGRAERGLGLQEEAQREIERHHKASLSESWKQALLHDVQKKEELQLLKSRQEEQSNAQKRADILARRQQLINQKNFGRDFDLNKWKAHTDANLRALDLEINADKMKQLMEHREAAPTNMTKEQELDFLADLLNKTSAGRNADRDRDMAARGQELGAIDRQLQNRQYLAGLNHQTLNMLTQNFASLPLMMGLF